MAEFMSLPELQQNPLVERVLAIMDTDGNGEIDFQGAAPSTARSGLIIFSVLVLNRVYQGDFPLQRQGRSPKEAQVSVGSFLFPFPRVLLPLMLFMLSPFCSCL